MKTNNKTDISKINGWGIDNVEDDFPNYPYKTYTGDDHQRINWERPSLQTKTVEILKSTERPYITATFGSAHPPKGLSGAIRRYAFRFSENMLRHWLLLLLADRVNVVGGILDDLIHGRIPRLAKERGWYAIARHKPGLLARKILVRVLVLALIAGIVIYKCRFDD